ncbi:MAG: 50S ribosomal protein L23 [candidate division NC10 bacterium]
MDPHRIIRRALVTEKGTALREQNKYVFEVDRQANKIEIKRAIEALFGVTVTAVHALNVFGKTKRVGRFQGRTSDWKKAIATLKEGQTIEFFQGT